MIYVKRIENLNLLLLFPDTLGILARTLGPEYFSPLAQETMELGLVLADSVDPDVKKATYILFASLSTVLKEDIAPFLPKIIELMIESLKSSDGVMVSLSVSSVKKYTNRF